MEAEKNKGKAKGKNNNGPEQTCLRAMSINYQMHRLLSPRGSSHRVVLHFLVISSSATAAAHTDAAATAAGGVVSVDGFLRRSAGVCG